MQKDNIEKIFSLKEPMNIRMGMYKLYSVDKELPNNMILHHENKLDEYRKKYGGFGSIRGDEYNMLMKWRERCVVKDIMEENNILPYCLYKSRHISQ